MADARDRAAQRLGAFWETVDAWYQEHAGDDLARLELDPAQVAGILELFRVAQALQRERTREARALLAAFEATPSAGARARAYTHARLGPEPFANLPATTRDPREVAGTYVALVAGRSTGARRANAMIRNRVGDRSPSVANVDSDETRPEARRRAALEATTWAFRFTTPGACRKFLFEAKKKLLCSSDHRDRLIAADPAFRLPSNR